MFKGELSLECESPDSWFYGLHIYLVYIPRIPSHQCAHVKGKSVQARIRHGVAPRQGSSEHHKRAVPHVIGPLKVFAFSGPLKCSHESESEHTVSHLWQQKVMSGLMNTVQ